MAESDKNTSSLLTLEELKLDPMEVFSIVGKLGEGSYGSVHKALHKRTSTICAIKLIPTENDDDTVKEINIMNDCDSKYVVQFYGSYFKEGYLWIVMEYCGAGSVSDVMRICGTTMKEGQIALICSHVLEGLKYLHERRKIHRDIKAGNILLNVHGHAKLADFGVAGQLSDNHAKRTTVIGTPFWMAPEVIQEVGYGVLADIWSLGITCIEMAEGHPPYHKIHPMRAIFMIPTKPPPRLEHEDKWSKNFIDFIAQCLTKNPNNRPSAEQLLQHPFIKGAPGLAVISETVSEVMDLIAKGALEDPESGSESEDEESAGLGTVQLDDGTIKQNKAVSPRRAFDLAGPTVGPQAAARKMEQARHDSAGETSEEDDESAAYGTMKINGTVRRQPTSSGQKMMEDLFDSYATGTMVPVRNADTGTMVISEGKSSTGTMLITDMDEDVDSGTMRRHNEGPSDHSDYQPAFMQYIRKGSAPPNDGRIKPANASIGGAGTSNQSGTTGLPARSGHPIAESGAVSSSDLLGDSTSLESLQHLLDVIESSMDKEIEATRLKYERKRAPILDAITAKKAALAFASKDGGETGTEKA